MSGSGAEADALARLAERGPGRMVPDLTRIRRLTELLGDPQDAAPVVHVTATNGKGSITRMVGALAGAAGLTAGTYTSPHLQDVRERLAVAGRPIDPLAFAEVHAEVEALAALVDAELVARDGAAADRVTYFELLTAMAFAWFSDVPVDLAVIEVGMGGRWDATNVVTADVAVIGAIDVDHAAYLGDTPAKVAEEKVGIIDPGAIVVTAAHPPDVEHVVAAAVEAAGATWWRAGRELVLHGRRPHPAGQELDLQVRGRRLDGLVVPLWGAHQADNALLAVGALAAVLGDAFDVLDDAHVRRGLAAVRVPGRLEVVAEEPRVVLDGAHNPHGARALAAAVGEVAGARPVTLVVGVLADKDVDGILTALAGVAQHAVVTGAPDERGLAAAALATAARRAWGPGVTIEVVEDPIAAVERAMVRAGGRGAVLVTGSLRTIGAARGRFRPVDEGPDVVGTGRGLGETDGTDEDLEGGGGTGEVRTLIVPLAPEDAVEATERRRDDEDA